MKVLIKLQNEIAEHLGIDRLPIKYEELELDDSRLYLKEEYVAINIKYKDNYLECAKAICHEYRHVFQIFYANLFDNERAIRWKKLIPNLVNSSTINKDGSNYVNQELEVDAFAFTKYYLKEYENIDVVNKIECLDKYLDLYIMNNKDIL